MNWTKCPAVRREGKFFYKMNHFPWWVLENPVVPNQWHLYDESNLPIAGPFKTAKAAMKYAEERKERK